MPPHPPDLLTPAQLNALARDILEGSFPAVTVEGEICNFSRPASGHVYFSLKDARAQVRCALFRPKSQWLRFAPANGMQVVVRGRLTLYEARGDYQLILDSVEEAGEGALRRAYEELKARLAAEGLFDTGRKRPVPSWIRRLAVVTSPTGAAVRDVMSVLARRCPLLEVEVLPVLVQGATAPADIVAMLERAYASGRYDALLLTRGGGSLEDLMAFNDERVVRTLAAAPMPTVCAVGHEIDVSLADFAADLRAATPSAAAELLVPDRQALRAGLDRGAQRMRAALRRRLVALAQQADHAWLRLRAQRPHARLARGRERLDALARRLHALRDAPLARRGQRLAQLDARLHGAMQRQLERRGLRLAGLARALEAMSPLAVLGRGYAIVSEAGTGAVVGRAAEVRAGQGLDLRFADGTVPVTVDRVPER
ncbi:exodeoxyribonuclease VII large subunit [Coralloluteibacterium thermophilus]|uniref:Exodeoxyribonuclease 7 large subunit n=1 Tax=Coralloluteibacterium thermophilum TaxID=2707049 RepID=A0ABV9NKU3_9GAMM